jgi:hypothetical protein
MDSKEVSSYSTWYEFKKELQKRAGFPILNSRWIQIKPKTALPWYEFQMKEALSQLSNIILKLKYCPRCGNNLITDRDVKGYKKRCLLCSFVTETVSAPPSMPVINFQGKEPSEEIRQGVTIA